jgi:hypothetical protein
MIDIGWCFLAVFLRDVLDAGDILASSRDLLRALQEDAWRLDR